MTRNEAYLLKGGAAFFAGLLAFFLMAFTTHSTAAADEADMEVLNMTALELQQEIESAQAAYSAAQEEVEAAAAAVDEKRKRLEKLEKQIPEQQERSAKAAREQYKLQQQGAGIVELLLSSDSFFDFISCMDYMDRVSDANAAEMNRLAQLKEEAVAEQSRLRAAQREAEEKMQGAKDALDKAEAAQAEVQRRIEEEARLQAEIAAQAAALAEEPRDNDGGSPGGDSGGSASESGNAGDTGSSGDAGETGGAGSGGGASAGDDTEDSWAARIDAYLAGSPLAGQGRTFARAALKYGVDPRFSPAISFTESSKGLYCFKPHNAWGWGSASWSSWEEAIDAHVAGLARGYGGQISIEGAKKYCPPNWKAWYNRTLAQMNMI